MSTIAIQYTPPSLKNHFNVFFKDVTAKTDPTSVEQIWSNPYASQIIKPYFPSDNQDLLNTCREVFKKNSESMTTLQESGAFFCSLQDASNRIFVCLSLKDLVNFSTISKCCYLATKADCIWEIQLQNCFPNTKILSKQRCSFSPEQQFKIYFKKMNDELKLYIAQFERNNFVIGNLRGPSGFDGEIDQARKEYQILGGDEARFQHQEALNNLYRGNNARNAIESALQQLNNALPGQAFAVYLKCISLELQLRELVGHTYNGTIESLDPNCQQALCLMAIQNGVPKAFDDQEQFTTIIEQSEAAKNNSFE
jgi:hypothetical protein